MTEVALVESGYKFGRYTYSKSNGSYDGSKGDVVQIHLHGGREEVMRFLGEIRPPRLLAKWKALGGPECIGSVAHRNVGIADITFIGEQEVVSLGTTTGTLIAEGFAHHNSIASAAFISASQGEKASQGRAMERGMADIRQQSVELDYQLDRTYFGDSKKRLFYPVGDKAYYTPSKDIPEEIPWVECVYPAAGYDPINADVRNIQKVGAGLKSKEEAMSEDPSITNAFDSLQKQYKEQSVGMVFQRGLSDPSFDYLMFAELMGQGIEPLKAVGQVRQAMEAKMAQQQALQAQQAQQQLPGAAGPEGQLSALQLEKGAVPGQTAPVTPQGPLPQPSFAGGPLTNILVGR